MSDCLPQSIFAVCVVVSLEALLSLLRLSLSCILLAVGTNYSCSVVVV